MYFEQKIWEIEKLKEIDKILVIFSSLIVKYGKIKMFAEKIYNNFFFFFFFFF